MTFSKLVRYVLDRQVYYGELLGKDGGGFTVQRLNGSIDSGFESSGDEPVVVKTVRPSR
jgi:hypothetical protein